MFTFFYESGISWFDTVANGLCWMLIVSAVAFTAWLGYDLVTGPRKQRAEVKRMLEGLDSIMNLTTRDISISGAHRPFAPGKRAKTADKQRV